MVVLIICFTHKCQVICIYSFMLILRYFTGCISHLSLIIVLNEIAVFIDLDAIIMKFSTK